MVVSALQAGTNVKPGILLFCLWPAGPSLLSTFGPGTNPLWIELRLKKEMEWRIGAACSRQSGVGIHVLEPGSPVRARKDKMRAFHYGWGPQGQV